MNKELEMKKYVEALRKRIRERAEQLEQTSSDEQKNQFVKLQDEITALAELYRYYCKLYKDDSRIINESKLKEIENIEQIEKLFSASKALMVSGEIDKEHLIEVAEKARQNLVLVCQAGNISEYAELLLEEEQKSEEPNELGER